MKIENPGGRKLLVAVLFWATGSIGLFTSLLSGENFVWLAAVVTGLYSGANMGSKFAPRRDDAEVRDDK